MIVNRGAAVAEKEQTVQKERPVQISPSPVPEDAPTGRQAFQARIDLTIYYAQYTVGVPARVSLPL